MTRLCLVEDDPIMGESLSDRFQLEGYDLDWFLDGHSAQSSITKKTYDLVVCDYRLPDISGEELFLLLHASSKWTPPFIFMTAHASIDHAVRLLKAGVIDYIPKPFDIATLLQKVADVVGGPSVRALGGYSLGVSEQMRLLEDQMRKVAPRASTVLITGESGVGKEVLAKTFHRLAYIENTTPFVAVNCGAIPENLIEDTLFGHEKGAFTGADKPHKGYFEQANFGTLFLDEIAELKPSLQVRLLRVLQEKKLYRLGGEHAIDLNLRIIFATHRNIPQQIEQGLFREDLFYRINMIHFHIPPLRDRPDDILWLTELFLTQQSDRLAESPYRLSHGARSALLSHDWPGNVRELQNRIERATIMSSQSLLTARSFFETAADEPAAYDSLPSLDEFVAEAEKTYLNTVLKRFDGRVGMAAKSLGISRKTLWEKCKKHGL